MERIKISELCASPKSFVGRSVNICGWVRTVRVSGNIGFAMLNDGSCFECLQVVFEKGKLSDFESAAKINVGAAVRIEGEFVLTPDSKQKYEIHASRFLLEGASTPDYPLQKKRHSPEYLRTIAHLRPRTNLLGAAFRIRSEAAFAIHEFFHKRGFIYAHTPVISVSDCEGAGEMFRVTTLDPLAENSAERGFADDFFGKPAYLTVSGQLEGEIMAQSFGSIYTFGPTFRAEKSYTQRHAAEFWMIEPEIAFADLDDDMCLAEDMMKHVISHCLGSCSAELDFLNKFVDSGLIDRLRSVAASDFARITYTEAVSHLEKNNDNFQYKAYWGCDLQTEHERYLTEQVFGRPVFVTDYPKEIKAFYMRLNDDGKTVAAMDCLVPGIGEIIGGSQREERLEVLDMRIEQCGLNKEDYSWYRDLRKYGTTKHAGFGLGFERLIMYLTGIQNIRDVLPFPRTTGNAEF